MMIDCGAIERFAAVNDRTNSRSAAPCKGSTLNASVLAALARKEDSKPRPLRNG